MENSREDYLEKFDPPAYFGYFIAQNQDGWYVIKPAREAITLPQALSGSFPDEETARRAIFKFHNHGKNAEQF